MTGRVLRRLARRSLPRTAGSLRLPSLEAPVEVVRDRFGIPHLYARSRRDLACAQGYVHAQDRLFQMETTRRFAFGRLSELAGARTLELDRLARRLRLRWAAERDAAACDPEASKLVDAYCEGVNAFIADGPLPLELRLIRLRPEPWSAVDVQAPAQMFALALCGNWEAEVARSRLRVRLGDERARRLEPEYPADHPVVVPDELLVAAAGTSRALGGRSGVGASNCFAVDGTHTASGKPILVNDPHLFLGIPGIWHAQHLVWDEGECAGFTVPGAPVVVLGRNRRVAWGMTTAMLDTQDLYVERFHPTDARRYEVDGEWVDAELVRETIRVRRRREPVVEEVMVTRHGPIVVPPEPGGREALALRWSHHEPGETTRSLLDLMTAGSVAEADRALDRFAGPPHNLVLADAEGGIAYRLAGGPVPIRSTGDGSVPCAGWESEHEWQGWVPQAELPRLRDPESGLIVSANNRIVGDAYPYDLPGEYLSGYRAGRLETLIGERGMLTPAACARILLDRLSLPGLELAAAVGTFEADDPVEAQALDLLAEWDGELAPESAGGAVYAALMRALEEEAFADFATDPFVPTEGESLPGGLYERARPLVLRCLAERDDMFLGNGRTWDDVLRTAVAKAVRELGPDPASWARGRYHRFRLAHAFDSIPVLRRIFSRGPFGVGGDADTVRVMARVAGVAEGAMIGASMRAVYDLSDPDANLIALVPGQSGHPASRHYDDLLGGWLAGEYIPLATDRARVEELAETRLLLAPE
jgi:penicillin G amidase